MSTAFEWAQGLRDLANWIEDTPDHTDFYRVEAVAYPLDDPAVVRDWARDMAPCEKDYRGDSGLFSLRRMFGPVKMQATFNRATVCRRVVTATTEETVLVPDPTVEVPLVEVTKTVETVEWICEPVTA